MPNARSLRLRLRRDPVGGPRRARAASRAARRRRRAPPALRGSSASISSVAGTARIGRRDRHDQRRRVRRIPRDAAHDAELDAPRSPGSPGPARRRARARPRPATAQPRVAAAALRCAATSHRGVTTALPDRRAAGTASRRAGARGARCARPACRRVRRALHPGVGGHRERRFGEHRVDVLPPRRRAARARRRRCRRRPARARRHRRANISPVYIHSVVDRGLHPRVRLSSVPSPSRITQSPRALDVIGDFLGGLGGDSGDARIGRLRERAQQQHVPGVEQELPRHRVGEVAVRLLDQQQVAELAARRAGTRARPRCARPAKRASTSPA